MKPFLAGRNQVSAPSLQTLVESSTPPAPLASQFGAPAATPAQGHAGGSGIHGSTVECVRQGDKVVRIIVTCSCGERTEIDCLYPAGG